MGRANVDLYTAEPGASLFEATTFKKQVGGSPANIAVGLSRLGNKVAFVTAVSDDPLGHFVQAFLANEGIDVTHVKLDRSGSRTSLAFAEVKKEHSDVLFYRNGAADMLLNEADITRALIQKAKLLLFTGTGLAEDPSRSAILKAQRLCQEVDVIQCFDLDYRASAWQDIEDTRHCFQQAAHSADIILGTREEIGLLAPTDEMAIDAEENIVAQLIAEHKPSLVVLKDGKKGATVFSSTASPMFKPAFVVDALKPYGAGDAFAAGFLHGLLHNVKLEQNLTTASAAAAIVVTRFGCASAMPTLTEIDSFLQHAKAH